MSGRLSRSGLALAIAALLAAAALFVVLNRAFGGPGADVGEEPYRVMAVLPDSQGLVDKSLVMVRGVRVGEVSRRQLRDGGVLVTLDVDADNVRVYRDATVRPGRRTLFGEAYVQLDPGHRAAGELPDGATLPTRSVLDSVELDEALETLDRPTRSHIASLARTGALVAADRDAASELNETIGGLAATLTELRTLSGQLTGQRRKLTELVTSSNVVLDELGRREEAVVTLVSAGRATTEALASDQRALRAGLAEAPRLLTSAREALRVTAPLARRARPVTDELAAAMPVLTELASDLGPAASSATAAVRALPDLRRVALPVLADLRVVARRAEPALDRAEPALRNLVPTVRYLAPYTKEIVGFVGGGTAIRMLTPEGTTRPSDIAIAKQIKPFRELGQDGAPFGWARFLVDVNVPLQTASRTGIGDNPYPKPGAPYDHFSGSYPRVLPERMPRP